MVSSPITFEELHKALLALGFTETANGAGAQVFRHASGALIVLPQGAKSSPVSRTHLAAVRQTLENYEIADSLEFASRIHGS
jgi:hypothetical protein